MDQYSVANDEGTRTLLAIKLRVDTKPVLFLSLQNQGGRVAHAIYLSPRPAAGLADWLLEPLAAGWGFEPGLIDATKRPTIEAPANDTPPDIRADNARVLCYGLDVLAWKLPAEYGPAWVASELAHAGIPIDWDSHAERFITKPLIGAAKP